MELRYKRSLELRVAPTASKRPPLASPSTRNR